MKIPFYEDHLLCFHNSETLIMMVLLSLLAVSKKQREKINKKKISWQSLGFIGVCTGFISVRTGFISVRIKPVCTRHGHCRYVQIEAIVKSINCPKNWQSHRSRQLFPNLFKGKFLSQLCCQNKFSSQLSKNIICYLLVDF